MENLENYTSHLLLFKRLLEGVPQMTKSEIQIKIVKNNDIGQGINDLTYWLVELPMSIIPSLSQESWGELSPK